MILDKNRLFKPLQIRDFYLENPVILAPLCGITDSPFRMVCRDLGAGLGFVEMISSTAIKYNSEKTFMMMRRHKNETNLGIQFTAKDPDELEHAINKVEDMDFSIVDLNMGCPAKKVVKTGGGSAILKDVDRLYKQVQVARQATNKPLSVKIRAGWDRDSVNFKETSKAIEDAGADMITIHGRTKADTYSVPTNLDWIRGVKETVSIPVIGNGDLFSIDDVIRMKTECDVDGVMLARGVQGNPFLFKTLSNGDDVPYDYSLDEWKEVIFKHIEYFRDFYGNDPRLVVTMRKHLLWYSKGWRNIKKLKGLINSVTDLDDAKNLISDFVANYDE